MAVAVSCTTNLPPHLKALVEDVEHKASESSNNLLEVFYNLQHIFQSDLPGHDPRQYLTPDTYGMISAARQRCRSLLERLEASPWHIDQHTLIETLSESAIKPKFLRALLPLTTALSMQEAVPRLRVSRQQRLDGWIPHAHKDVDWSTSDIDRVMASLHEQTCHKRDLDDDNEKVGCVQRRKTSDVHTVQQPKQLSRSRKKNVQDEQLPYQQTNGFDDDEGLGDEGEESDAGAMDHYQQTHRPSAYVLPSDLVADLSASRPLDPQPHSREDARRRILPVVRYNNSFPPKKSSRSKKVTRHRSKHSYSLRSRQGGTQEQSSSPQSACDGRKSPSPQQLSEPSSSVDLSVSLVDA
ncbi:MAG: hypothetical protein Q9171_003870 [Xanthocarpia ochracea]